MYILCALLNYYEFTESAFLCPLHIICRITVPGPGIEPWASVIKAASPNYWTASTTYVYRICMFQCVYKNTASIDFLKPVCQSVSSVTQLCPTLCAPWTAVNQDSLSITNSQNLLKLMSTLSVMPSNHLILCRLLLLLPSSPPHQVAKVLEF